MCPRDPHNTTSHPPLPLEECCRFQPQWFWEMHIIVWIQQIQKTKGLQTSFAFTKLGRKFCENSLFSLFCCIIALVGRAAWDGCCINTSSPRFKRRFIFTGTPRLYFEGHKQLALPPWPSFISLFFPQHFFLYPLQESTVCSRWRWINTWTCYSPWAGGWLCPGTEDTGPC